MSVKKSRTKMFKNKKINYCIEFTPYRLELYIAYGYNHVTIELKNNFRGDTEEQEAIKLLKLMYKLLKMEIAEIQTFLKVKFVDGKIVDKNNKIIEKLEV